MIRIRWLGAVDVTGSDGRPIEGILRQPKRLALLAYLTMPAPGAWHRRDTLLALFWPELDTRRARTSLRNALYVIRQHLGEHAVFSRGDEEVAIDPALVYTDVAELRALLSEGEFHQTSTLYGGDLLDGVHASGAQGFEHWLDAERTRIRREVTRSWSDWCASRQAEGDLGSALLAARRIMQVDPFDEPSLRRVMELQILRGDRAGALEAYQEFRTLLWSEFEATPSAATETLAAQLRLPAQPATAAVPVAPSSPPTVLPEAHPPQPASVGSRGWRLGMGAGILAAVVLGSGALLLARSAPDLVIGRSRPVTTDEGLQIEPAISSNGRLVAFAQGDAQRMRIHVARIDGSATWQLTRDTTAVEILPRWSPDNDAIVFLAHDHAWVARSSGGEPRLVVRGSEGEGAVRSASWSAAGDSLLVVRGDSVLVVPLAGPGSRLVGTGSQLHSCAWSPAGDWIACVSGNWVAFMPGTLFGNRAPTGLVMFPARGGTGIDLTDRLHEHQSPTWSADGKHLWFLSNRDGQWGEVYRARIGRNGRISGTPLRMGLSAEYISIADGRLAYSAPSRRANVFALAIPDSGAVSVEQAIPVTTGNHVVEVTDASPDDKWLVFDSDRHGNPDLFRWPTEGGELERLTDDPRAEFTGTLDPTGELLAYHRWEDGFRKLRIKRLADGRVFEPLDLEGDQSVPRWSPDGSAIALWHHDHEPGSILVIRRDTADAWREPEWILEGASLPVWSPDGSSIAFVNLGGEVRVVDAITGVARDWYSPRPGSDDPRATFLSWRGPGGALWFLGNRPSGASGIWRLQPGVGEAWLAADLRDSRGRRPGPSLTTDGHRWYFTLDERTSNVRWVELVGK